MRGPAAATQAAAVPRVADVAGDRDDVGAVPQRRDGVLEGGAVAGVDDEPPAAVGQGVGEGEAETPRGPGDDGGGHGGHAACAPRPLPIGNGS